MRLNNIIMYLVIDIGNTLHKTAVFSEEGEMAVMQKSGRLTCGRLSALFSKYSIDHAILSSVGKYDENIEVEIRRRCPLLKLSARTLLPVSIKYKTPCSLGPDRIANAVAAHNMFPDSTVLSVQLGTCMVCDIVDAEACYWGGSISPGIDMRLKALHHYTNKLPQVVKSVPETVLGKSTEESILSGVVNGILFEFEGIVEHYKALFPDLKVLVIGGDADYLQMSKKITIFAPQYFVLLGLYQILRYNLDKCRK